VYLCFQFINIAYWKTFSNSSLKALNALCRCVFGVSPGSFIICAICVNIRYSKNFKILTVFWYSSNSGIASWSSVASDVSDVPCPEITGAILLSLVCQRYNLNRSEAEPSEAKATTTLVVWLHPHREVQPVYQRYNLLKESKLRSIGFKNIIKEAGKFREKLFVSHYITHSIFKYGGPYT